VNDVDIEENIQKLVKTSFNSDTFIYDFIASYDGSSSLIKQLKSGHQNFSDIPEGVLWRRNLHYKSSPQGRIDDVMAELQASEANSKYRVRYIITTDGNEFAARDLIGGSSVNCLLHELPHHFHNFRTLAGMFDGAPIEENPIDVKATKQLTKFYDSILTDNPDWRLDENRHALNHFITQIIFCLFAEDTGVFEDNLFSETIRKYCAIDSTQAEIVIGNIFTAMAYPTTAPERGSLPAYAQKFPHVNGGLFRGTPTVPRMLKGSVRYLGDAGALDWKEINPDIFGSMIQAIVHQGQRGELGMHYTSVSNILKVLNPLFLDDLRGQMQSSWNSKKGLQRILRRLMKIRVFDPACGSGNFLVIAYRELRDIEIQTIRRLAEMSDYTPGVWSHVEMHNFYGIEYADFAAETANLSLWIAEYQMNKRYEHEFGKLAPSLPLKNSNNIRHDNALRINWEDVCPHAEDPEVETYIVGNPPYIGRKQQKDKQKEEKKHILEREIKNYKSLDYVCGWFYLASIYIKRDTKAQCAFVTTNSINQGQHVSIFWPIILNKNVLINFAYKNIKWTNNASKAAAVTVNILGLAKAESIQNHLLVDRNSRKYVKKISPYLTSGSQEIVYPISNNKSVKPIMKFGNMAYDGGNLILSQQEKDILLEKYPACSRLIKRFMGSEDAIHDKLRYCLWISDSDLDFTLSIPTLQDRIEAVRQVRLKSSDKAGRKLAEKPHQFRERHTSDTLTLVIPRVFTENRLFITARLVDETVIINDAAFAIFDCQKNIFSIISSLLHRSWIGAVCGQLETRIRYSNTLGWNTFPVPDLTEKDKAALTKCAEDILLARDHYFEHTIAELYDPDRMQKDFPELWEAHQRNDAVLETIYNGKPFDNDTERLEHLFERYVEMTSKPANKQKGAGK
jgi:hypothetical protein